MPIKPKPMMMADNCRTTVDRWLGIARKRADAAFAMPEVYEFLEAERIKYAIRLPVLCTLPERRAQRSRSPNWLKTNSG